MATVILVRHGRTTANAAGVLAGRTPGVELDEVGREQVSAAASLLAGVPVVRIVTSPLERCRQTAHALVRGRDDDPPVVVDDRLTECGYGDWQNRPLSELAKDDLWKTVQRQPSAARFPGGESLLEMQTRAVEAVRDTDAEIERAHGTHAVWVAVSHGDVIKSVLADALGMHLDLFQRLSVRPASISVVRHGPGRPEVAVVNGGSPDLTWLARSAPAADAPVGGGSS